MTSSVAGVLRSLEMLLVRCREPHDAGDTVPLRPGGRFGYRLREWPELRPQDRTAKVYGALSVMSGSIVSVTWLARRADMDLPEAQEILDWLAQQGYAEQIPLPG